MKASIPARGAYQRPVSGNERMYMAGALLSPPFAIQAVVEGEGTIDVARLQEAVNIAAEHNPGCRLILKDSLMGGTWIDSGVSPPVHVINEVWIDDALADIQALKRTFDLQKGPTCEILVIPGHPFRLLFRAFHGVMDAQGVLFWMEEIFRALDKKPLLGSHCELTDIALARSLNAEEYRPNLGLECGAITGMNSGSSAKFLWRRFRIPGKHPGLVAKLAFFLSQRSREHHPKKQLRFMVPVDLRPHLPAGTHGTGNLSNPLFVSPQPTQTWSDIHRDILESLAQKREGIVGKYDHLGGNIPVGMYRMMFGMAARIQQFSNRFVASGLLSNIGRVNADKCSCSGFRATAINFLPFDIPISPFTLVSTENDTHVEISVSIPEYLGDGGRIERLLADIEKFLVQLNPKPSLKEPPRQAPLLTDADLSLINRYNDTHVLTDNNRSLWAILQQIAVSRPEQTALQHQQQIITYGELLSRVQSAANVLSTHQVAADDLVCIVMDRSNEMVIALLAILWVGAAYVPVDPAYPLQRQRYILENAGARCIIADERYAAALNGDGVIIDAKDLSLPSTPNDAIALPPWNPRSLAYVIYTSGSTGQPKGVEIERHNLMHYATWAAKVYADNKPANFALFSSLAFDLTVTSIFVPLLTGGSICVYSGTDPLQVLSEIFQDDTVDIIKMTPSHLKLLTELPVNSQRLAAFIVGGEDLLTSLCREIDSKFRSKVAIFNEYGPTEATVGCMIHRYDLTSDTGASVPIGVPADNTHLYVLDDHLNHVKPGSVGELYIAGSGVARGYRGQPELTAQKFIRDPFVPNAVMYRSGDLVTLKPTLLMDYHGRVDEQVKIGGYRIELGEIQQSIERILPDATSTVLSIKPSQAPAWLCAFIAPKNSDEILDSALLRSQLAQTLPPYMVPQKYFQIDSLPITVNGKIDANALRQQVSNEAPDMVALQGLNTIDWLRSVWSDILHYPIDSITVDSDFYDLGGDSLKMVQLLKMIREQRIKPHLHADFSSQLPRMLAGPTLKHMRELIDEFST